MWIVFAFYDVHKKRRLVIFSMKRDRACTKETAKTFFHTAFFV